MMKKKNFRFSLRGGEHEELIRMIENCPKSLRNELIILALKMLNQNKSNLMLGQDAKVPDNVNNTSSENSIVEKQSSTADINVADIFKF